MLGRELQFDDVVVGGRSLLMSIAVDVSDNHKRRNCESTYDRSTRY